MAATVPRARNDYWRSSLGGFPIRRLNAKVNADWLA